MNYTKPLPELDDLQRISQAIGDFPIGARDVVELAETSGFGEKVLNFLKLFRGEFESRGDFYGRTSELALLIDEERRQPEEGMLSQQD